MGWERKARKTAGVQSLASRRNGHQLRSYERRIRIAASHVRFVITLDSDTRLPHAVARATGRHAGTPSESASLRSDFARRVTHGYGVLQPRVSVQLASAAGRCLRESFPTAADSIRTHRRVRRLSGSVWRRQFHRQRNLRRRCVFRRCHRLFPRQSHPQPRLDRGLPRACRLGHRHRIFRRVSDALRRRTRRQHRWIRGDWQILPWLLPRVPMPRVHGKIR